jgi:spoIIIJ-associated protein
MSKKAKDFYSKSVTEAIRQACAEFGTSQEKLDIEVVETGSQGIFGLCKKRAHIRVNLKKDSASELHESVPEKKKRKERPAEKKEQDFIKEEECSAPEVKQRKEKKTAEPKKPEETIAQSGQEPEEFAMPSEEVLASIKEDLEQILTLMGFASVVTVQVDGQSVQCHIKGDSEESIVGQEGRTLDSLQYLIRKIASNRLPDKVMVDLDVGNYREQRVVELQKLAQEMAEKVKETGKTMAISALNPSERRVVHVALQDDKKIRSRSVGDGIFKKVLIFKPGSKGRKPGARRRGRQGGGSAQQ